MTFDAGTDNNVIDQSVNGYDGIAMSYGDSWSDHIAVSDSVPDLLASNCSVCVWIRPTDTDMSLVRPLVNKVDLSFSMPTVAFYLYESEVRASGLSRVAIFGEPAKSPTRSRTGVGTSAS